MRIIRIATIDDKTELEALQLRASLANETENVDILGNPDCIWLPREQIESGQVFVMEEDRVAIGFAAILNPDANRLEIDGLFVEPNCWRSGAGRMLVQYCVTYAREKKINFIDVVGHQRAKHFYEACGFTFVCDEPTRFGMAIRMKCSVN